MKPELRRMGAHRLVDIYAKAAGSGRYGSGYAVGDDLVLTAAHVVPDAPGYQVRTLDYEQFDAELVWSDPHGGLDAALLRVAGAPWANEPDRDSLRWGKVAENGVKCWALGFPRAQEDAARRRDVDTMHGSVDLTSASRSRRYDVDVTAPRLLGAEEGRSWWQGISGAALFGHGRELLGVLVADLSAYGGSRLEAVRAERLLRDEEFSRLVGAGSADVEEVWDRGEVAELDGPDFLLPPYKHLPEGASDAQQLLAEYAVVPFIGREAELQSLRDWTTRPDRFGVAVVRGDQGAGKTRLGAELCKEYAGAGWSAGFMGVEAVNSVLTRSEHVELVWPTLLVIDEPDRLTDQVIQLIDRLSRRRRGARLRLLLLSRTAAGTEDATPFPDDASWWRKLNRATEGLAAASTSVPIRLRDGQLTESEQRRHVDQALAKFSPGASLAQPLNLDDRNPLGLHLAVLNAVRGDGRRHGDSPEKLLLNRETTRWMRLLAAYGLAEHLGENGAHQALALVTMTAPEQTEAVELLTAVPALDAGDASRERRFRISEWLAESYPGGTRLGMPSHSMVVEQLLEDTPGLDQLVVSIHDHPARTTRHLAALLETVRLAAGRHAKAREALHGLLSNRLAALVEAVTTEPDSQLPGMVDAALNAVSGPQPDVVLGAAAALLGHPQPSEQFTINQLRCRILELAVDWHAHQPTATLALADTRTDLTAYRAALGDLAGAQATAEDALSSYRRLPSAPAASLARAYNNLGTCLALRGELDQAGRLLEEATSRSAGLAAHDPTLTPAYVDTLVNLAACQADQGHQVQAITTLLRAITAGGREGILGALIEPLGDLARGLARAPQTVGATKPDPRCYRLPEGTGPPADRDDRRRSDTLLRLTARLTVGLADHTRTVRRDAVLPALIPALARQQARFAASDHAEFLRLLSEVMARQNEFEYAIAAVTESVALARWVAAKEGPGWRVPKGLSLLAYYCYRVGRLDEAITHATEAVAGYRLNPGFVVRSLPDALADLARYLRDADRLPEAVENQRAAVALYRELADQDDAYLPSLGGSLIDLGSLLIDVSEPGEAATALQAAAALFDRLTAAQPEYTDQRISAYSLLAIVTVQDDSAQSVDSAARAVDLAQKSAAIDPGRWIEYARALCMLSTSLVASGRFDEAFEQAEKVVTWISHRDTPSDDELRTVLGWGLLLMSETARSLGRPEQALTTAREAISTLAQVADNGPDSKVLRGSALTAHAAALYAAGLADQAIPSALEALELFAQLGTHSLLGDTALLTATTDVVLSQARLSLGRAEEALASALAAQAALQDLPASQPWAASLLTESCYFEGSSLAMLDRPGDALQSLARAAGLQQSIGVGSPPDAGRLARILAMIGTCHLALSRADLATEPSSRSIELFSGLGELQPSDRVLFAQALNVHGACLSQLGDAAAAYQDYQRIVALYCRDLPTDPASQSLFGWSLAMSGLSLLQLGDPGEALPLLTEAASVYRGLDPGGYGALSASSLAMPHAQALAGLAECQAALGDLAAAAQTAGEGIERLRAHQSQTEPLVTIQYGRLAKFQAQCLLQLGQPADDEVDLAIGAFRSLDIPEAALELAQALALRALYQDSHGDTASAAQSAAEAVNIYRELPSDEPGMVVLLASTLRILGVCLLALGQLTDASATLKESASHLRNLVGTPVYPVVEHLEVELKLGMCLTELDRSPEAAEHFHVVVDILRQLAASEPGRQPALAHTIAQLSEQLINFRQAHDVLTNAGLLTEIVDLNAEILSNFG
jgi:tetratricopeptide (TPR) repeat protein